MEREALQARAETAAMAVYPVGVEVREATDVFLAYEAAAELAAFEQAEATAESARNLMIIGIIISLLVGSVISVLIGRYGIGQPMTRAIGRLNALAGVISKCRLPRQTAVTRSACSTAPLKPSSSNPSPRVIWRPPRSGIPPQAGAGRAGQCPDGHL